MFYEIVYVCSCVTASVRLKKKKPKHRTDTLLWRCCSWENYTVFLAWGQGWFFTFVHPPLSTYRREQKLPQQRSFCYQAFSNNPLQRFHFLYRLFCFRLLHVSLYSPFRVVSSRSFPAFFIRRCSTVEISWSMNSPQLINVAACLIKVKRVLCNTYCILSAHYPSAGEGKKARPRGLEFTGAPY